MCLRQFCRLSTFISIAELRLWKSIGGNATEIRSVSSLNSWTKTNYNCLSNTQNTNNFIILSLLFSFVLGSPFGFRSTRFLFDLIFWPRYCNPFVCLHPLEQCWLHCFELSIKGHKLEQSECWCEHDYKPLNCAQHDTDISVCFAAWHFIEASEQKHKPVLANVHTLISVCVCVCAPFDEFLLRTHTYTPKLFMIIFAWMGKNE